MTKTKRLPSEIEQAIRNRMEAFLFQEGFYYISTRLARRLILRAMELAREEKGK